MKAALRFALWWVMLGLLSLALVVAATGAALWAWSGSAGSLATAVQIGGHVLPHVLAPGQSLEVQGGSGALREGGTIALLRWKQGAQTIEAHDATIAWDWRAVRQGRLVLPTLHMRLLRIDAPASQSSEPLTQLLLPLPMDVKFAIDTLELVAPSAVRLTEVQGHYIYDGQAHVWDITQAQLASGRYSSQGRLQAAAPMALTAQLNGTVQMRVPKSTTTAELQAKVQAQGTLSGLAAALDVTGDLRRTDGTQGRAMPQATVQARIHPWQAQPVVSAQARWSALDVAALWPQYPQTLLAGSLQVAPDGAGWRAQAQVQNAQPGPLDQQRLPLQSLEASVLYRNGQWVIDKLSAMAAGGTLQAQGRFSAAGAAAPWSASATLAGVNPAKVDTRLAPLVLGGTASAELLRQGIGFALQLQSASEGAPAPGISAPTSTPTSTAAPAKALMRLKSLQAKGVWNAPTLQLDTLRVLAQDATLEGHVSFNTRTLEASGQLSATAPGAQAQADGALSSAQGQGVASLRVTDANALGAWLARLPFWSATEAQRLALPAMQGAVDVSARWQGGWQQQGEALRLDAQISSQRLDVQRSGLAAAPMQLSALQATVAGTLRALELSVRGKADIGTDSFALQAQAHGGLVGTGRWDAWIDSTRLTTRSALREGEWALALAQPVALQWRKTNVGSANNASGASSALSVAAGTLQLTGPAPGNAQISWQPVAWSQKEAGGPTATTPAAVWQSRGSVQGLPLAWLEILGQTQIANLGLRGDLVFGGQWDATGGDTLNLRATLERTSGDLQLVSPDAVPGKASEMLRAGLRQARVDVQIDQQDVSAKLRWATDNAGNATVDFSTRLQRREGAWVWSPDAPVAAQVRANLPRVGVWSLLAPPGWRIQGTLDANTTLAGTRAEPNWSGTLEARDLSVRSVVDGIDFANGRLRVRIAGQRMDIEEFSLQGAGGESGGLLKATGSVVWLPASAPNASNPTGGLAARLRMELDAVAQALRVSARADRRLVVSGNVSARLSDARLSIRGALVADQAVLTLPEDTAPQLGADVVVRPTAAQRRLLAAAAAKLPAKVANAANVQASPGPKRQPLALDMDVTLDPGSNFQVTGHGLVTRLAGRLNLTSESAGGVPAGASVGVPRLTGELRTVRGTYKAYGQTLDIRQGLLRFTGAFDNPALDILALRPNLQQTVGVQIGGTAQLPVVRLYAEPDLPDAEKLSWLLLGRAPSSNGGDTAILQQAALAFLSGSGQGPAGGVLRAIGLDEVSLGETTTPSADGSTGTASTTVKLGKRLSRDFYVAYERGIATTLGTFYVFYDLSRRFTLRAESGNQTAVDLIFTTRFD